MRRMWWLADSPLNCMRAMLGEQFISAYSKHQVRLDKRTKESCLPTRSEQVPDTPLQQSGPLVRLQSLMGSC